jgi:hypothetical protein
LRRSPCAALSRACANAGVKETSQAARDSMRRSCNRRGLVGLRARRPV